MQTLYDRFTIKLLFLLIFLGFSLLLTSCDSKQTSEKAAVRPVKAIKIGLAGVIGRTFPGQAKATRSVDLAFEVSGTLTERPINIGDIVKKGQLIARLNPRDFEDKLKSAQSELERDQLTFERAQALIGNRYISRTEFDQLKAKLGIAKSNLDLAEKALSDSVIRAPFDGRISNLYVDNYQAVAPKQIVARLLDTSKIEMIVHIPESMISYVPYVKEVSVRFDAFPNEQIPAKIKEISNEASPTTRTYPVTLIMQQPKTLEIFPGMAGNATFKAELLPEKKDHNLITVPATAVFTPDTEKNSYVWVIDPKSHRVHRRAVTLGELTNTGISILNGISIGEWVVIAGVHSLHENQQVTLLKDHDGVPNG